MNLWFITLRLHPSHADPPKIWASWGQWRYRHAAVDQSAISTYRPATSPMETVCLVCLPSPIFSSETAAQTTPQSSFD